MTSPTGHQKPPGTTESRRHPLSVRQSGQQRGRLARRHLTQYILDLQVAAIVGVADGYAQATRLLFQGRHCGGIEYRQGSETKQVSANAEVVICAGAIDSSELLLPSGIGDALVVRRRAD